MADWVGGLVGLGWVRAQHHMAPMVQQLAKGGRLNSLVCRGLDGDVLACVVARPVLTEYPISYVPDFTMLVALFSFNASGIISLNAD